MQDPTIDLIASKLEKAFNGNLQAAQNAAKTCMITLEGKKSVGNEFGIGIRIVMQTTRGAIMEPIGGCWFSNRYNVHAHSSFALAIILGCIGYTLEDFLKVITRPHPEKKITVTLKEVVEKLAFAGKEQ